MDSFLTFFHEYNKDNYEKKRIEEEKRARCLLLKKKFEDCVKLNKYILGNYYEDKLCENAKTRYFEKCK